MEEGEDSSDLCCCLLIDIIHLLLY
jgi:hypothetical protein